MGEAKRVTRAITSIPWAITEDYLRLMVDVARRQNLSPEQVEAQRGEKLQNTYAVEVRNGVAILPVRGLITRYMNLFSEISGGTSIQALARDFNSALKNSDISAILLNIDSPGGEANGINEFAEMIFAARGRKPITAYIGGTGASAAYWLASAADEIVCDASALVGSIGTVAVFSAPDENEIVFVSSQSPRKHPDITEDEGKADILAILDAMTDVFVGAVARNRGVTADHVLSNFGQGGIFVGQAAVQAGMVDRLGSFEATLAGMSGRAGASLPTSVTPISAEFAAELRQHSKKQADSVKQVSTLLQATALSSIGTSAPSARPHTTRTTKEKPAMENDEKIVSNGHAPPDEPELTLSEEERAQVRATERARMKAEIEAIRNEARLEMQREIARYQREQKLTAWAQDATSPRLDRPKALPVEAKELTAFVLALDALSTDLSAQFQALTNRILLNDLIDFSEHGSEGGADERDVVDEWKAAIQKKRADGLTQSAAIEAIKREQPDLFRDYNASGATVNRKGGR